jgi:CitB family two-component system response regulator CitT
MINVLIAEDDFRIADLHEKFLKNIGGVQVIGKALNAGEAIKIAKEQHVDLLLLDIYMPDKLGTDLIHELRNQYYDINFIVITAATHIDFLEESLRNGVVSYLIKPVTLEKFTESIESFKQRKKLLESSENVDQRLVDHLFKNNSQEAKKNESLPKGIDPITLKKVIKIVEQFKSGITAEEMGGKMGASRTTARRYLEYLVSIEKAKAELEYGIVGRPERKYYA